ncbi:SubName: Full=Related to haloacid dehalogenase, type II-Burkholderia phytofirmans {ECO:0000313/EMBL:CCA67766.1} [Serendipita indica DSM 11827]|nr:SubName: Full=Related to haloacid dehalogenase, type II-Burkholderia phytofirmans {ECO:0000313/EMBL:CCA67766.1} [Serendipita indica DSM 11827]
MANESLKHAKALLFDYMGTVTDWLTPVSRAFAENAPSGATQDWVAFAHKWRGQFFTQVAEINKNNSDFVSIHDIFDSTLSQIQAGTGLEWDKETREALIRSWGGLLAFKDSQEGLRRLREKYTVVILTNGITKKIIESNKRNALDWDLILGSDIVGAYKPNSKAYQTAIKILGLEPSQCIMVAAHAYDLEAAASHGMRTAYIKRDTEDMDVNLSGYSFDVMIAEGGLLGLASIICD